MSGAANRLTDWGNQLASAVAHLLWPACCMGCDRVLNGPPASWFCSICVQTLRPPTKDNHCSRCALPMDFFHNPLRECTSCRATPPPFGQLASALWYGGAIGPALQKFKWGKRDDLARPLGTLLAPLLADLAVQPDAVVPVPLDRRRLFQRGYNQAVLLAAQALRQARNPAPLRPRWLQRTMPASDNRAKSVQERQAAVQHAFVVPPQAMSHVRGKNILLVDDVVTTGATVHACTNALLDAGAQRVDVLSLCRAVF